MATPEELRAESRLCLQTAMAQPSRTERHRLARHGLALVALALKIERDDARKLAAQMAAG